MLLAIYYCLFYLLNTVLNLLNIHIYTVNILRGSHNIERVQRALDFGERAGVECQQPRVPKLLDPLSLFH